ncbi:hypothetical protein [Nocardia abscessus]|uniref:hypothetical protein n=1 Tax=Nocardia abscessus TaxID=120957 RepID=UPI00031BC2BE|nr:hypothetical protein [Nocardia abscessus]MCC3330656.1 hypothetical protein [Nocardia abscessus]
MRFIFHYPETAGYDGDLLDAGPLPEIAAAAERHGFDLVYSYNPPGITTPTVDAERHRAALAELAQAGVDWIVVSGRTGDRRATLDFLAAFGETYLERSPR